MGHKVSPLILRIGINKNWNSIWVAKKNEYANLLALDTKIRDFIRDRFKQAAISKIEIDRVSDKLRIRIYTARPGIIIGRHGQDIEKLKSELRDIDTHEALIDIKEIKEPTLDAQLVAQNIALQLEKRIAFRRAMKRSIEQAMLNGAGGIKISCSGRLGGAEMSRKETYKQGKVPLQTLRADIDYGITHAKTTYGYIGVKVWIYKGDVLAKKARAGIPLNN